MKTKISCSHYTKIKVPLIDFVSSQKHTLAVQHIRTGDNVADFFTKALQGSESFDKFRTFLMGSQDFGAFSKRE